MPSFIFSLIQINDTGAAPEDVLLVSENGLRTSKHLRGLRAIGYKGFLTEGFNPLNMII